MTNEIDLEAAMCLWEAYVAGTLSGEAKAKTEAYREAQGTPALRHAIMGAVEPVQEAWRADIAAGVENCPYDWEHCPTFLSQWIIDNLD